MAHILTLYFRSDLPKSEHGSFAPNYVMY